MSNGLFHVFDVTSLSKAKALPVYPGPHAHPRMLIITADDAVSCLDDGGLMLVCVCTDFARELS